MARKTISAGEFGRPLTVLKHRIGELRQRWFPDSDISRGLRALEWCDDVFGDELVWEDVKARVRFGLLSVRLKGRTVLSDDNKAARLILTLIKDVSISQFQHGNLHIYRGVLGFDGKSYRDIAEIALSHLHEGDWLDYEEYQAELEHIAELVKAVG